MSTPVSRRTALAALATATAAAGTAEGQTTGATKARSFLLVHGGWHGGWCWSRVAGRLRSAGHLVFTPTLTGLGERSHLFDERIGLETHVNDVVNVIRWEGLESVVLVGHSLGGFIASGVAERAAGKIGSIVFLDAFVPENGQALADLASENVRNAIRAAQSRGEKSLPPIPAANFRVNEKDRAWVDEKCTPQPLRSLVEKIALTGARERIGRKTYIRATEYPSTSFDAAYARARADSSWRTFEIPCGHDAMIDLPDRVAEILLQVA
jgi:pimeloyl-ACP methyl ester carboxylesterase